MGEAPSRAAILYGTEAPVPEARLLRAGPLTVELVGGALRYARYRGVEVLRGIDYLARDRNWGTYAPEIGNVEVREDGGGFRVAYDGRCGDGAQELTYRAEITGEPDGSLRFRVVATPVTDFETNRTGFIVLHPLEGVAGRPVEVTHADGRTERATFPRLISPGQPFFDVRALSHEAVPGLWATCTMAAGDAFEMEDHRNWSDASYKTYVRPLALPTPYTLPAGEPVEQSVSLTFRGRPAAPVSAARDDGPVTVAVGAPTGPTMPRIGLGVPAEHAAAAVEVADLVAGIGPQLLVGHMDPRKGHGADALRRYKELAEATGAAVVLELVVPAEREPAAEVAEAAGAVRASGVRLEAVAVVPAPYLKSIQPSGPWPDIPPLEAYYDAARVAFPGLPVGGGMFTYFTELNRKRPPADHVDFVTHTTCAVVHDADDRAVMEALEALPYIAETTRSFVGDTPYRVGPSMIGMRLNPYGPAPVDNPANRRMPLAGNDPRQRGLLGAAWNAGYVAEMARAGVEAVTLSAPVGEHGVIHRRMPYPQPYFDDLDRGPAVYPLYHVIRAFAAAAGAPMLAATSSAPGTVRCVAWRGAYGEPSLVLANMTDRPLEVALSGLPGTGFRLRRLDADAFVAATTDPEWWEKEGERVEGLTSVTLDAYAVASVEAA